MSDLPPVEDWTTDWDHHDPAWVADPFPIWDDLRQQCPVAHTGRYNEGVWLPTRFDDVTAIAHNTDVFSSGHSGGFISTRPSTRRSGARCCRSSVLAGSPVGRR